MRKNISKKELRAEKDGPFTRLKRKIGRSIYDFRVKLRERFGKPEQARKPKKMKAARRNELLFCIAFLAIPVTQMLIFYFGVNFNSIILAFKSYDATQRVFHWSGFFNLKEVIKFLFTDPQMAIAAKNSAIMYFVGLLVATPLNLIFAYLVFKKIPLAGFFRVVLFLPAVISSVVLAFVFRYAVDYFIPWLAETLFDKQIRLPTQVPSTAFPVVIIYGLWTGFGSALILYAGAMARIPDSVLEYGKLEGIGAFTEFTKVIIPMIFPTITTFLVVGIAGFFTNYGALYIFYGAGASSDMWTLGYYWFTRVVNSTGAIESYASYPQAAAAGLVFTAVCAPITLLVKHLLEKYGPTAEY